MVLRILFFHAVFFFFKQKTAYEISECDWSSDVCSSDLEDLGDDLYARICRSQAKLEAPLYEAAVDLLIDLSGQPQQATLPPYSDAVYRRETSLLPDWYLRSAAGGITQGEAMEFLDLVSAVCAAVAPFDPVLVM